jgi:predicted RNase H-like nuclease (RuvC/YqgF family)
VADILQFPSKFEINRVERLRELNEALDRQEEMLQDLMRELDMMNEEIVKLTTEYNSMLKQLKDLVMQT